MNEKTSLERIEFEEFNIRRAWHDETERWWFAVVDVVKTLSEGKKPRDYWYRIKKRVGENEGFELSTI